jgi:hypothetical protein
MRKTPPGKRGARVMGPPRPGSAHYVFVILPHGDMDETQYRRFRRQVLQAYCMVLRNHFKNAPPGWFFQGFMSRAPIFEIVPKGAVPQGAGPRRGGHRAGRGHGEIVRRDLHRRSEVDAGDAGSGRRPPREGRAQEYRADSAIDDSGVPWVGMKTVRGHYRLCRIRLILTFMECC